MYALVVREGEIIQGQSNHTHCGGAAFSPLVSTASTLSIKPLNAWP